MGSFSQMSAQAQEAAHGQINALKFSVRCIRSQYNIITFPFGHVINYKDGRDTCTILPYSRQQIMPASIGIPLQVDGHSQCKEMRNL